MAWDEAQYVINKLEGKMSTDDYTGMPPDPPKIRVISNDGYVVIEIKPPTLCNISINNQTVVYCNHIRLVREKLGSHSLANGKPIYEYPDKHPDYYLDHPSSQRKYWDLYLVGMKDGIFGAGFTEESATTESESCFMRNNSTGELVSAFIKDNEAGVITNGETYLYRAYAQSDHGVWQLMGETTPTDYGDRWKDSDTRTDIGIGKPTDTYIWGFDQNFKDLNPATTISYPDDVANAHYQPMMTNSSKANPTIGDWGSFLTQFLKCFPFMVKKNGEADYGLYTGNVGEKCYVYKKENPTHFTTNMDEWASYGDVKTPSDYNNLNYQGGAFVWINKIYIKETYDFPDDNNKRSSRKVRFTNRKIDDDYKAIGFLIKDENGELVELEGLWIPMGYTDNNGRVLISGTHPSKSKTTSEQKTIIDNSGFQNARFFGGPILNILRDLEYMLYKHTNLQEQAGYGRCGVSATDHQDHVINNDVVPSAAIASNDSHSSYGFWGNSNKSTLNKIFHTQALQSFQCWLRDPYAILKNGDLYLSPYYQYDLSANGYKHLPNYHMSGIVSEQYMNRLHPCTNEDFGAQATSANSAWGNASSSTGLCDAIWWNREGIRIALRVGSSEMNVSGGPCSIGIEHFHDTVSYQFSFSTLLLPPVGYSPFTK